MEERTEGEDYPRTLGELEGRFTRQEACVEYLQRMRWPEGFRCPACGGQDAWRTARGLWHCRACGRQTSVVAGTIFHASRKPLPLWFRAMWHITSQKYGANALGLQRVLGLGSYHTAWEWLHKLRRAMVRPGRDGLSGTVEVDETYVGGRKKGKRGRGAGGKEVVAVAVEDKGEEGLGRIRLGHVADASGDSLGQFVSEVIEPGSTLRTDGWQAYLTVPVLGYGHTTVGSHELKLVHLVVSLLKRWLLATYQGAVRPSHLTYYLDEFTFRFNRRSSRSRGKLFYRLVQQALMIDPAPAPTLKGPALAFLQGRDNANLDPLDPDTDHNI